MAIKQDEREQRIQELIDFCGFTRGEAEQAIAIELGEIEGDVITEDQGGNAKQR